MKLKNLILFGSISVASVQVSALNLKMSEKVEGHAAYYSGEDGKYSFSGSSPYQIVSKSEARLSYMPFAWSSHKGQPEPVENSGFTLNDFTDNTVRVSHSWTKNGKSYQCDSEYEFFVGTAEAYSNGETVAIRPTEKGRKQLFACLEDLEGHSSRLADILTKVKAGNAVNMMGTLNVTCASKKSKGGKKCEKFAEIRGNKKSFEISIQPHTLTWRADFKVNCVPSR